jgi:hypothetical protein
MVTIVRVGPDPFGRGETTVFYRDSEVNGGREIFYLWASHWLTMYPTIQIPPSGYNIEPPEPPPRPPCVPYVLEPGHPERLSNLFTVIRKPQ